MNYLVNIWLSGSEEESRAVREGLEQKVDSYAAGELEHAVDAMSSIWEVSSKEGPVPSVTKSPSDILEILWDIWMPSSGPSDLEETRHSLIRSIKEGYLLDRKYWARRSKKGGIDPIYFSNTMAQAELLPLDPGESLCPGGY